MWRIVSEGPIWLPYKKRYQLVKDLPSFDSEATCNEAIEKLRADRKWKNVRLFPVAVTPGRNALLEVQGRQENFAYFFIVFMLLGSAVAIRERFGWAAGVIFFVAVVWAFEMFYRYIQAVRIRNIGKWWAKPR